MGLLLTSFTDRSTHLPPVARRDLSKNIFFFIAKFEFVVSQRADTGYIRRQYTDIRHRNKLVQKEPMFMFN